MNSLKKKGSIDRMKWWQSIRDEHYIRYVLWSGLAILLYILMLGNIIPEKIDITLSQIATQDIRSPISVENKAATEERRTEATNAIETVYELKRDYAQNQVEKVNDIFDLIRQVSLQEEFEEGTEEEDEDEEGPTDEEVLEERLNYIHDTLALGTNNDLTDETLTTLLETSDSQLTIAQEATTNAVYEIMSERISIRDLNEAKEEVQNQIAVSTVSNQVRQAMIEVGQFAIIPNYIYDSEATERLRQQAADSVEPVIIREGQLIVKEGEIVNHEKYEQLRIVGLLDDSINIYPYIGLALLVLLIVGMLAYFVEESNTSARDNNSHLLMFMLVFSLTIIIIKIASLLEGLGITGIGFIVPVSLGAMLFTLLLQARMALFASVLFAVIGAIFFLTRAPAVHSISAMASIYCSARWPESIFFKHPIESLEFCGQDYLYRS